MKQTGFTRRGLLASLFAIPLACFGQQGKSKAAAKKAEPMSKCETYCYDVTSREMDNYSLGTTFVYDASGRLTRMIDPLHVGPVRCSYRKS
jgi:hypothetical protein